jgi:serine/threonine protein kinase
MAGSPCPDLDTLLLLSSGQLPESQSATLHEHVEQCPSCTQVLSTGGRSKSRIQSAVLGKATGPGPTVMERVEPFTPPITWNSLECKRADSNSPTPGDPVRSESAVSPVKLPSEITIDFLAPAQNPDELGRLGGYRVLSVLGEGGMGVVFKAEDPRLKRLVALKVMKPDKSSNQVAHQRFIKEGELAAALQHDHIVTIYRVDEDQGVPFLAMQFLEGESLDERLRREGKLPAEEIIRIAREAAEGLGAAHDKGLIHRDIKPANIWLETLPGAPALGRGRFGGRVKILDFGLARAVADQSQHLTQTGMVVGTPDYMAPEQARTGQPLDGRCDLFSLGSVMYRMSTGRKPFQGDDIMGTLLALAMEDPPAPRYYNPEIPPQLSDMIRWLMAKSPGDRPRTAQDVVDSLAVIERNLADGTADFPELSGQPAPPSGVRPLGRKDRRTTTTAPQIGGPRGGQSGLSDRPPSAPSTLSKYGLHSVEPTQTAKGVSGLAESTKAAPTVGKATPALSPLLKDLVGRSESLTEIRPKVHKCPKCGHEKFSSVGWCLSCGYSPQVQELAPPNQQKPINSAWIILGGVVGVILATAVCHITLRLSPQNWMNWVRTEAGLGLAGIVIGYIWNYYCVLPYFGDHTGNLTWNPLTLLSAGIHQLPKTRWALSVGAWGMTAVACIAFLVGDISFWWSFKVKVPIPTSSPIEFERSDSRASISGPTSSNQPKKISKSTKPFSVVGVSGGDVVLAETDSITGAFKYAGRAPMSGSLQEKLQNAKSRTEPVLNAPNLTGVKWIEPFSCDVEFSKRDDNGVLLDPTLK